MKQKKALVVFGSWKGRIVEILYKYKHMDAYFCKYHTNKSQSIISTIPGFWLNFNFNKLDLE